jgi:hypothetical protein
MGCCTSQQKPRTQIKLVSKATGPERIAVPTLAHPSLNRLYITHVLYNQNAVALKTASTQVSSSSEDVISELDPRPRTPPFYVYSRNNVALRRGRNLLDFRR